MLLCYITDRSQFRGDELSRQAQLLERISQAAACGVDFVQLREKDLSSRELEVLARRAKQAMDHASTRTDSATRTRLLINSRTDVALATGADGVHLRSGDISPEDVSKIWAAAHPAKSGAQRRSPVISVSCHSADEVARIAAQRPEFVLFAPVFEKRGGPDPPPAGLEALGKACRLEIPVIALGGITLDNAGACLQAGAAGVAGIRLFQEGNIEQTVRRLRNRDGDRGRQGQDPNSAIETN